MVCGRAIAILVIFCVGVVVFKIINITKVRTPIDLTEFKSYMEEKEYVVNKVENISGEKNNYVARKNGISIQIIEFFTTEYAEEFFENKKEIFKEEYTVGCTSSGWSLKNYSKYHLNKIDEEEYRKNDTSILESYKIIYRVENVVMYSDVKINKNKIFTSNKKEVEKIFKKFGY